MVEWREVRDSTRKMQDRRWWQKSGLVNRRWTDMNTDSRNKGRNPDFEARCRPWPREPRNPGLSSERPAIAASSSRPTAHQSARATGSGWKREDDRVPESGCAVQREIGNAGETKPLALLNRSVGGFPGKPRVRRARPIESSNPAPGPGNDPSCTCQDGISITRIAIALISHPAVCQWSGPPCPAGPRHAPPGR